MISILLSTVVSVHVSTVVTLSMSQAVIKLLLSLVLLLKPLHGGLAAEDPLVFVILIHQFVSFLHLLVGVEVHLLELMA